MQLEQFVSATLSQILSGVRKAQTDNAGGKVQIAPNLTHYIDPRHDVYGAENARLPSDIAVTADGQIVVMVDFDVVLTKTEGNEAKGGIGVFLGSVGLGAQRAADKTAASETTIHFRVPVVLPH